MPLAWSQARDWGAQHMPPEAYQAEFGDVREGTEDVRLNFQIPAGKARKLERAAAQRGISRTALLVEMIDRL